MALKTIGKYTLNNGGGYVARGKVAYEDDDGQTILPDAETGDILLGQTGEVEPSSLGVPDGSKIWLHMDVVGGKDAQASQAFLFQKGSAKTANYSSNGTVFGAHLGLDSIT